MPSGTQARLPATLPTPTQARSALKLARAEVKEKANVAEGMKDRMDAAKDEIKAAAAELEEAEQDLLAADATDEGEADAEKRQRKAWKRLTRAELDRGKVKATLALARKDLKGAAARLAAAREDLEAIAEGKRKP